jgi:hypothetical protein
MFFFFAGATGATVLIWMKWETFEGLIKLIIKAVWFLIKLPFLILLSPILIPLKSQKIS